MFEKCGLKDITYRLYMWRRTIAVCSAIVILFAAGISFLGKSIAGTPQKTSQEDGNGANRHAEQNYAYYYVSLDPEQEQTVPDDRKSQEAYFASSYKQTMGLYPTVESICNDMLEKYSAEELSHGINTAQSGNYKYKADLADMIEAACQINVVGNSVIEIYVTTDNKEIGQELLRVCKEKLESMQKVIFGSKLNYIGEYYTAEDVKEEPAEQEDYLKGAVWLLIAWIAAVLIFATVSAIFFPTINYDSDFELYGVNSFGGVSARNAPAFALRLQQDFMSKGGKNIGLLTTRKDTPQFRRQCRCLTEQLEKLGIAVRYGADGMQTAGSVPCVTILSRPNENGEAFKMMMQCDILHGLEVAGRSRHNEFDALVHFVSGMPIQMKSAILIR